MTTTHWQLSLNRVSKDAALEEVERHAKENPGFHDTHVQCVKKLIDMAPAGELALSGYGYIYDDGRTFMLLDVIPVG